MDQDRRDRIADALRGYRETVQQRNLAVLRVLVETVDALPAQPGLPESFVTSLRLEKIQQHISIDESIKTPRQVLDERFLPSLIGGLDGVSHHPVDLAQREQYFAGIKEGIEEKGVEVAEFPPADLEYLCTLVSGITGPGLPFHQEVEQFDFVSSPQEHGLEHMISAVVVPIRDDGAEKEYNMLTYVWEDWEIAVGFKIGGGPRTWGGLIRSLLPP